MLEKFSLFILFLAVLGFFGYYLYESLPGDPVLLSPISSSIKDSDYVGNLIGYGDTPVFMEKLRFNKDDISYYIETTCSEPRRAKMIEAFSIFHNEMKIISFYEEDYQDADILIGCSNDYIGIGEHLFAAGEGGPSQIIDTANFNIIKNGKISLYKESDCEYPVVELHELNHVFGFDHSQNPNNIMYAVADCDQRITSDMVTTINDLYSIEPLPDLEISSVNAVKKGRYLDFDITVSNNGLTGAEGVMLTLYADGERFQEVSLDEIGIGFGRVLTATNIRMPERDPEEIRFVVDEKDTIKELDENNNVLIVS